MEIILLIPEIDKLLEADKENTQVVKKVLFDYNPDILDVINQISTIYETACRSFAHGLGDHFDDLNGKLKEFRASNDLELEEKLSQSISKGQEQEVYEAFNVLYRYFSRENRGILLSSLGDLYAMAV